MTDVRIRTALVREPGDRYRDCLSSHPLRKSIDVALAREQHAGYRKTLGELGLEVVVLQRDDENPDSCFVEDTAVVHEGRAVACRPAMESRRAEVKGIEPVLTRYMPTRRILAPATLEGGDVVHVPGGLISGVSARTNEEGVRQMQAALDVGVTTIEDRRIMHLKSFVSYLGGNSILVTARFADHPALERFDKVLVPEDEAYAANALSINGTVVVPKGFPKTEAAIRGAGFDVVPLRMTEFPKCEGAMTCLSILF